MALIRNVDAAQPVVQAIVLPLSLISGIFIPASERPRWLADIGKVFPVQHLTARPAGRLQPAHHWDRAAPGRPGYPRRLGAAGLVFALLRFNWLPRGS